MNLVCPKCGSQEVIEVGTSRAMCQECYEVFDIKPPGKPDADETSSQENTLPSRPDACPICGDSDPETEVDECPVCERKNICKKTSG